MDHKLSVTVQVDLNGRNVRILATGCLTEASQQALPALIDRASTLTPGAHVTVDLSGLGHAEAGGVDLLRWAIECGRPHDGRVELLLPDLPVGHPVTGETRPEVPPGDRTGPEREPTTGT